MRSWFRRMGSRLRGNDDPGIVKTTLRYLEQERYAVLVAYNGCDVWIPACADRQEDCHMAGRVVARL